MDFRLEQQTAVDGVLVDTSRDFSADNACDM